MSLRGTKQSHSHALHHALATGLPRSFLTRKDRNYYLRIFFYSQHIHHFVIARYEAISSPCTAPCIGYLIAAFVLIRNDTFFVPFPYFLIILSIIKNINPVYFFCNKKNGIFLFFLILRNETIRPYRLPPVPLLFKKVFYG